MKDTIRTGAVMGAPRTLLRFEGLLVLTGAAIALGHIGTNWWLVAGLFLLPDLGMLGYFAGPRVGAAVYNAAHTYLAPAMLAAAGWAMHHDWTTPLALIWGAHIGFDRVVGYGLKYGSAFGDTHFGRKGANGG